MKIIKTLILMCLILISSRTEVQAIVSVHPAVIVSTAVASSTIINSATRANQGIHEYVQSEPPQAFIYGYYTPTEDNCAYYKTTKECLDVYRTCQAEHSDNTCYNRITDYEWVTYTELSEGRSFNELYKTISTSTTNFDNSDKHEMYRIRNEYYATCRKDSSKESCASKFEISPKDVKTLESLEFWFYCNFVTTLITVAFWSVVVFCLLILAIVGV